LKTKLALLAASFLSILSPVVPMVLIAILMIIVDTFFGIWRSYKKGGWNAIRSRKMSHALSKTLLYSGAIVVVFLIEKYIAGGLVGHFISVDLVMTKLVAFYCVVTELKSVNEKYEEVTGKNILKKLREFVTRAKEEAKDLTE
jgi:hypothetical protein